MKACYESIYLPLSLKKAVDGTLHLDKFSSLRPPEKREDSRNGGKAQENEAVFFGKPLPG